MKPGAASRLNEHLTFGPSSALGTHRQRTGSPCGTPRPEQRSNLDDGLRCPIPTSRQPCPALRLAADDAGHTWKPRPNRESEGSVFRATSRRPGSHNRSIRDRHSHVSKSRQRGPRVHRQCSIREVSPGQPSDEAREYDRPFVDDLADHDPRRPQATGSLF